MKRVGRLLIYVACAMALSFAARADITPVTSNPNSVHQSMSLTNRLMMMKRRHHAPVLPSGLPGFSHAIPPQPNLPHANVPQPQNAMPADARANTDTVPTAADTVSGDPYESIVTRNVFGLNPIPVTAPSTAPTGPPPPKITLTGITTIFGPAEALFKVAGVVRGNGRPQDESYIFTEGEQQDDVEVTSINTNKMIVSFMNHGVKQDIPLADGVASTGSAPSAPTWSGQSRVRRFPGQRFNPGNPSSFPTQSYRPYGNGNNGSQNGNTASGAFNNSQSSSYHSDSYVSPGISQLSDDDQQAIVAAAHAQAMQDPNSSLPSAIFPPTKFDNEAGVPPGDAAPSDPTPQTGSNPR